MGKWCGARGPAGRNRPQDGLTPTRHIGPNFGADSSRHTWGRKASQHGPQVSLWRAAPNAALESKPKRGHTQRSSRAEPSPTPAPPRAMFQPDPRWASDRENNGRTRPNIWPTRGRTWSFCDCDLPRRRPRLRRCWLDERAGFNRRCHSPSPLRALYVVRSCAMRRYLCLRAA